MSTSETILSPLCPLWKTQRFRLLGIAPLLFFLARVIEYAVVAKTPEHILWSCHVSNLMMAVGLFFAQPWLIRISVFWQILGVPPWAFDMLKSGIVTPVSVFSHLGGFVVAIVAIREVGAKLGSWIPSMIFFLVLQQITRLLTEPGPYTNVNVAHFAYGPWKDLFASYWKYWVVNTAILAVTLLIIDFVLLKLFPQRTEKSLEQRVEEAVREEVSIVPSDPEWPRLFEIEAENLRRRLPESLIARIEHFGSTAVPGLSAKPVIDILVEVRSLEETRRSIVPLLESEGYEYFWRTDVSPPYAWFIKRNSEGQRTHHIHMVEADSKLWERLYFRDYLREFPDEARRYEELKRHLSDKYPNDRFAYTNGKAEFVATLTERALQHYRA